MNWIRLPRGRQQTKASWRMGTGLGSHSDAHGGMSAHPRENGMDCCGQGHTLAPRHWMWRTTLTSNGAMLAGDVGPRGSTTAARTAETTSAALQAFRKSVTG